MRPLIFVATIIAAFGQTPTGIPPVPVPSAVPQWKVKFFHDKNDSAMAFDDLVAPAPGTVCAFGSLGEGSNRPRGVMVTSRDAGKTWQTVKLPDLPVSADFVDASNGWLVVRDAVHRTTDGGLTWTRAAKLKGVLRVKFLTPQRGFAIGFPKAVWQTDDAGISWTKVPAADEPASNAENTTYSTITFANPQRGLIIGQSRPPRRDESRVPAWMDPEMQKRLIPNLTILLETADSGKTWKTSVASAFGQVTRVVFSRSGMGLGLMEYTAGSFSHASELVNLSTSKSAFLDKAKAVRDVTIDGDGKAWVVAVEVPGKLNQLPIPSKIVVLQSIDFEHWYPSRVDYKAVANHAKIAFSGLRGWIATDSGMILTLE